MYAHQLAKQRFLITSDSEVCVPDKVSLLTCHCHSHLRCVHVTLSTAIEMNGFIQCRIGIPELCRLHGSLHCLSDSKSLYYRNKHEKFNFFYYNFFHYNEVPWMEVHLHSCTFLHKESQHLLKVCILHNYLNWHMHLQSYAPTSVDKSHIVLFRRWRSSRLKSHQYLWKNMYKSLPRFTCVLIG